MSGAPEENVVARLRVEQYRGIEFLDTARFFPNGIPRAGMVIKGPNGVGKTSVLNAILAACAARDIGPDAIRLDAEASQILVNMTKIDITRTITPTGSRLTVKDHETGKNVKAPAEWLKSMLGTSLDPLEFMRMKPDKQKAYVLSAIPIMVTEKQVAAWLDGWTLSDDVEIDYSLHGLEVVSAIRKDFFERRAEKNAEVKTLDKEQAALEAGAPPAPANAPAVEVADREAEAASTAVSDLKARAVRVATHAEKTSATRARAKAKREEADVLMSNEDPTAGVHREVFEADIEAAAAALGAHDEGMATLEIEIESLAKRLEGLREQHKREGQARQVLAQKSRDLQAALTNFDAMVARRANEVEKAAALKRQADELEATIALTADTAPTEAEIEKAAHALALARQRQADAKAAAHRKEHDAKVAGVATRRAEVEVEASKLDAMVKKFSSEIPNLLLTEANGVPGLSIDDDEVSLDGIRFSKLSGRERLMFCVQLARRLNTRAKILVTDGLEAVDADLLPEFIAEATAGGYQLIATRVEAGEITFEALAPAENAK